MRFPSQSDYELLIYTLAQTYPEVLSSSLRLYTTSRGTALVKGSVHFHNGLELRVSETIDFVAGQISDYGYTVFRGEERVRWYDPQPHADVPELTLTFPHHYHEPPDIKRNRRPAPGIGFQSPNLPTLIADCVALVAQACDAEPTER
jgi:hypothetical protein